MLRSCRFFRFTLSLLPLVLLFSSQGFAQLPAPTAPRGSGGGFGGRGSTVIVRVTEMNGTLFNGMALVSIFAISGSHISSASTQGSRATFTGLGFGTFRVEASAAGYETARSEITINSPNGYVDVEISLKREADPKNAAAAPSGPPILAPKAQKELGRGLEELRASHFAEARRHLDDVYRVAPGNPDVNYLLGLLAAMTGHPIEARAYWEKTIGIYPHHAFALLALGDILMRSNDFAGATDYFKRAAEADPSSWRSQGMLSEVSFQQRSYEDTVRYAGRAIDLGKAKANNVRWVEARALAALGRNDQAIKALEAFLASPTPDPAFVPSAQRLLEKLRNLALKPAETPAALPVSAPAVEPPPASAPSTSGLLPLAAEWKPPDVDDAIPVVEQGASCPLDNVLRGVGARVKELLKAVDRFTATESLLHEDLGASGLPSRVETRRFSYLVSIEEIRPRMLNVEEYRDGSLGMENFPASLATKGLPTLVLVFHPYYQGNYEMRCEGLSRWHGNSAWQIHFRQRPDRPAELRTYRIGGNSFAIPLKGRVWISESTSQILRMEMDAIAPVPEARLRGEHIVVNYGPVRFRKRDVELWLPNDAEVFMDFRGRHMHRRHSFTNYLLFSVDEKQDIKNPKVEGVVETTSGPLAAPPPN